MSKYSEALESLKAEVEENSNLVDSAVVLIKGLRDQVQAAIDNQDFSQLKAVVDMLDKQDTKLAQALVTNTPEDPNPPKDPGNGDVPPVQTPTDNQDPGTPDAPNTQTGETQVPGEDLDQPKVTGATSGSAKAGAKTGKGQ